MRLWPRFALDRYAGTRRAQPSASGPCNGLMSVLSLVCAAAFVSATVAPLAGQSTPRTPWGDPDLQGTYTNTYENGTPLERPDEMPAVFQRPDPGSAMRLGPGEQLDEACRRRFDREVVDDLACRAVDDRRGVRELVGVNPDYDHLGSSIAAVGRIVGGQHCRWGV